MWWPQNNLQTYCQRERARLSKLTKESDSFRVELVEVYPQPTNLSIEKIIFLCNNKLKELLF